MIYLDNAASTALCSNSYNALIKSLEEDFANPHASHRLGLVLNDKIENAREFFLKALGGERGDKLLFTSSATESNNLLILGLENLKGKKVLYSKSDHPSITGPVLKLLEAGVLLEELPLKNGSIDFEILEKKLRNESGPTYGAIFLSWVGSVSGVRQDGLRLRHLLPQSHLHLDISQGLGKFDFSLKEMMADSLSFSSHKISGPLGVAGLYLKKGVEISPLFYGGGQEYALRPSTVNTPLILSFKEALKWRLENKDIHFKKMNELYSFLVHELLEVETLRLPFLSESSGPYILTLMTPMISSDILVRILGEKEIYVASSSACSSKIKGKNTVYSALGLEEARHKEVLRISLDVKNTIDELKEFLNVFLAEYRSLKSIRQGRKRE